MIEPGRGSVTGRVLDAVVWVHRRENPFRTHQLASALTLSDQATRRILGEMEARGLVVLISDRGKGQKLRWCRPAIEECL